MSTSRVTVDIPSHLLVEFQRNPQAYTDKFIELLQGGARAHASPSFQVTQSGSQVHAVGRLRARGPDSGQLATQLRRFFDASLTESRALELNLTQLSCSPICFLETLRQLAQLLPNTHESILVTYSRSDWHLLLQSHEKELLNSFEFLFEPGSAIDLQDT
ncbi:MAG: hypothetical protein ING65_14775 [Rhodocyclaceae bacterium]|nr:hypothetical protein [Rhodocyclaceae bacterium]